MPRRSVLELELAELSPEEAEAFRDGRPSALADVTRRLTEALDLISFFTAGDKETRAWTLRRGQTALEAAETIHSDIARGFIRAEVVRCEDLIALGSVGVDSVDVAAATAKGIPVTNIPDT